MYWDSHQPYIRLQIGAGTCVDRTTDAIATGEVNCCTFIFRLRSSTPLISTVCTDDQSGVL